MNINSSSLKLFAATKLAENLDYGYLSNLQVLYYQVYQYSCNTFLASTISILSIPRQTFLAESF